MKMEDFWIMICRDSDCSEIGRKPFCYDFKLLEDPSSCLNHVLVICFDVLLLIMLLLNMITKSSPIPFWTLIQTENYSNLQLISAMINGSLGLLHLLLGIWVLEKKLTKINTAFPLNRWLLELFQGFTWLLVGLIISLRLKQLSRAWLMLFSVLMFFVSGMLCAFSMSHAISSRELSLKATLDVLSFPGAILLLLCTYKTCKCEDTNRKVDESLYAPLNGQFNEVDHISYITPFAKAGFFSRMSFWWLNPLMKRGQEKTLQDEDIPKLRELDRAKTCYLLFLDHLNKQKQKEPSSLSILWIIILCHWREILVSGIFALLKVLSQSAGPLLVNAFILVAEGNESFKYEGYVLAISLFFIKIIESQSQRQWYFRSRLIGMNVKSLLTTCIYKKLLRLSNVAKLTHSGGEIMNYVTVDAYRIGELPFWFHQTWTTSIQLCIALVILLRAIGLATIASLVVIVLTMLCNIPLAKFQHKFHTKFMVAQDERLKASSEALVNMKVLKLYAWETHFKNAIEKLRNVELKLLASVQLRRAYNIFLFWSAPILVSAVSFWACYFLNIPLHANNVFTFVATLRLVQEPITAIPDVVGVVIQAKFAFARLNSSKHLNCKVNISTTAYHIKSCDALVSYNMNDIPTFLSIEIYGKFAYVAQTAWIQTGTIRENILFGSDLDMHRYQETLHRSSLVKDIELFPHGDLTEIGEREINLSGGQKQRIQLARALYQNADLYLLDDPFSAVDANTATNLFNEYIMERLEGKTVLLLTHQVDFLPAFDSVLLMSNGEILQEPPYHHLLSSSQEFQVLVNSQKETCSSNQLESVTSSQRQLTSTREITQALMEKQFKAANGNQLIKQEERETGDTGLKPYLQYLTEMKSYIYFSVVSFGYIAFVFCQILQNSWMAANVDNPSVGSLQLIVVYFLIGAISTIFLLIRCLTTVALGIKSSKNLYVQLMHSLFRAPMSFYDSTPLGRILSRVSSDLSIVDLDIPISFGISVGGPIICCSNLLVLAIVTWPVLLVAIPMVYIAIRLQRYFFASAKEVMRMNGTTKSFVANHVAETVAGVVTIRAFEEEDRFFEKNLDLIDINASAFFHSFSSNEWLIQRLEMVSAVVLASAALCMVMLPPGTFAPGFIGMALSYEFSLNAALVLSIQRGHKIGVVGRTGSGKSTLIGALFPLVEPAGGKIVVDGMDISSIGLHDLRSRFCIIPQDPTLFNGTVRYNLDPLLQHSDQEIREGSNWSMGQRQLFCLGRALLRRSKILVLDEATASIDNITDTILQKTIRTEFADCTVITVAHRIPTVMDCTMVLSISEGNMVEYDEPMSLMKTEGSLFKQLVNEYNSHFEPIESH
ncbi:hypothetical protein Fmac_016051 [Flemingia macrophylla]|uniref:ABC-type xenobiotic transporter n=1 Tax=Flemingia macrophylla TaxID=520843 RepID=A0ABD1MGC1_9FABA